MPRAVEIGPARAIAALAAAYVGVLYRVQIDRLAVCVLRPRAGAASADARRGHRLPAFEGGADVAVGGASLLRAVRIGDAHVADREADSIELAEHERERRGR